MPLAVAVSAQDHAFRDLVQDLFARPAVPGDVAEGSFFLRRVEVMEVQRRGMSLTAIGADNSGLVLTQPDTKIGLALPTR